MSENLWLKVCAAENKGAAVCTTLNDKQVFVIKEYFDNNPAGRCFFNTDDFDEDGRPTFGGTITAHALKGAANKSKDLAFRKEHFGETATMAKKAVHDLLEGFHHELLHLKHLHWSVNQELHHSTEPTFSSAVGAGLVNWILMFGFCCCYGMMIFKDPGHAAHRMLGIRMNMTSVVVMGLVLSRVSRIPIAVGGPDMNAVIFISAFVKRISETLLQELHLDESSVTGPEFSGFCKGDHYTANAVACDSYNEQLRATVVFSVTMSTAILSICFLIVGGCHLTLYISYMPTGIVDAFLSCMGYKVLKFAIKICKNDPTIFIPAAGVGVPLYFLKAMHIGNPMYVMPAAMILPFIIHYMLMISQGWTQADARERGYFFYKFYDEDPFSVYKDGVYASGGNINFTAWWSTKYDLLTMVVVCMLDCLVTAIRTSESKLPVKVHKNWEMMAGGLGDIIGACFCCVPGYMQLKFNVMNYGILQNVKDRRAAGILALIMAIIFFLNIGKFLNLVPKIFICMLLFFSASGFVCEHLYGSHQYLSRWEWIQVLFILLIFVATDEIIYAVTVGITLCGITFILQYSYIPCIAGRPLRGGEIYSREYYSPMVCVSLRHIADNWLLVIRLKGFIFFASVQLVIRHLRAVFEEENDRNVPHYERVKFIVLDCELLDGMDSSAEKDLQILANDAEARGVRFLWSRVPQDHLSPMLYRHTIRSEKDVFDCLENAILYIEGLILEYRKKQQLLWEELHPAFALNRQLITLRESFEPFMNVLRLDVERFGCPWEFCSPLKIRRCRTCLWVPNEQNRELFLVHTGAVGIFHDLPDEEGDWKVTQAQGIYRHGWLINRETLMKMPTKHYAVAVEDGQIIYWTRHQWWRMSREQPAMAQAIMEAAMRQANMDIERISQDMHQLVKASLDESKLAQSVLHTHHRDDFDDEEGHLKHLPDDLLLRLEHLEAAQSLESFRLYEPLPSGDPGGLPALPDAIRRDLEIAFHTYCVTRNKQQVIPWEKVNEALMYAGIFNALLEKKHAELTQAEFVHVGHEAALMRLSTLQIAKIHNVFKEFANLDGHVNRDDLIIIFHATFLPNITEQEVNGIAETYDDDGSGSIDVGEFVSIVSRFVRRHEQDWNLLRGFREVLNKRPRSRIQSFDTLNAEKLIDWARNNTRNAIEVSQEEAEEMMWSNACFSRMIGGRDYGKLLDWSGIGGAVMVHIERPFAKLPPTPVLPEKVGRRGGMLFRGGSTTPDFLQDLAKFQEMEDFSSGSSSSGSESHSIGGEDAAAQATVAEAVSSEGEADDQPLLSSSQRRSLESQDSKTEQKTPRRKKSKRQSSSSDIKPAEMMLEEQEAQKPKNSKKSVTFPEYDLLGLPATLEPLPTTAQDSANAQEGPRAERRSSNGEQSAALISAKEKFGRAVSRIMQACAAELAKVCCIDNNFSPLAECVIDLRNYPPSTAVRNNFCKTRLPKPDFSVENRKSQQRRDRLGYQWQGGIPNTPDAKIFLLLEDPASSRAANIWSIFMGTMIVSSVILLFMKPILHVDEYKMSPDQKMYWKVAESCFTIIFLGELVVRFAVCGALQTNTHRAFFMQPMNIMDFVSVLPFFLERLQDSKEDELRLVRITRLLRLARVMRLARLSKKSKIFGPVSLVVSIIWGIYLRETTT